MACTQALVDPESDTGSVQQPFAVASDTEETESTGLLPPSPELPLVTEPQQGPEEGDGTHDIPERRRCLVCGSIVLPANWSRHAIAARHQARLPGWLEAHGQTEPQYVTQWPRVGTMEAAAAIEFQTVHALRLITDRRWVVTVPPQVYVESEHHAHSESCGVRGTDTRVTGTRWSRSSRQRRGSRRR